MQLIVEQARYAHVGKVQEIESEAFGASAFPLTYFVQAVDIHGSSFLVARDRGQVLGYVIGAVTTDDTKTAWLSGMAVRIDRRRQKVGQALLVAFLKSMKQMKLRRILLTVASENRPAISLYESLGFSKIGRHGATFGDRKHRWIFEVKL